MTTDSGETVTVPISWYCGEMKAYAVITGNRVVTYRYSPVNGCGFLNRPGRKYCQACGRRKRKNGNPPG